MRIKAWSTLFERIPRNAGLEDPAIIDAYRDIYFFVNKEELETFGDVKTAKVILINSAITRTNIIDRCDYRSSNNTIIIFNLYTLDVVFENGIRDLENGQFILQTAFSSSTTNIWDRMEPSYYRTGNSVYSNQITNCNELGNYFEDFETINSLIPEPPYYTVNHMEIVTKDFHALNAIRTLYVYSGRQLIDKRTRTHVLNEAMWTTIYNKHMEELKRYRDEYDMEKMDITEVSDALFNTTTNSMVSGLMYGYDSLKGLNKIELVYSPNIPILIPFQQYQIRNKVKTEIESVKSILLDLCKKIESNFGNFRLYYSPTRVGDKVKMEFLDYLPNNQPIFKNSVDVDRGTPLNNHLCQTVNELNDFD